jgi:hypothetical protein
MSRVPKHRQAGHNPARSCREGHLVSGTKHYSSWPIRAWPVAGVALLLLLILAFYGLIGLGG